VAVRFGVDQLLTQGPGHLHNKRLGLVTSNVATVAFNGETSRTALRRAGFNLVRLFGPEHGLAGTAADGAPVEHEIDPATRLPVISLYGNTTRPPLETLADLDAILYDIPDVGARVYTYIWTLSLARTPSAVILTMSKDRFSMKQISPASSADGIFPSAIR
jgi:uncharacterized protein YbbC (DUF1343 family)